VIVFSNTTPFIALSSIGQLDLLPRLFNQVCVMPRLHPSLFTLSPHLHTGDHALPTPVSSVAAHWYAVIADTSVEPACTLVSSSAPQDAPIMLAWRWRTIQPLARTACCASRARCAFRGKEHGSGGGCGKAG
jgi:hypothetical protein